MNVLFCLYLFVLVLILRLGMVQIVYGPEFKREVEKTEEIIFKNPVPRGKCLTGTVK